VGFPFSGGVAVITGGASGIGLSMAKRFAAEGMALVLADVEEPALQRVAEGFAAAGTRVAAQVTDVADARAVEDLAELAYDRFGAVDVLCNNAGVVSAGRSRPIWAYDLEDWRWSIDVNVMGVVHGIRAFVPRMIAAGRKAHVVNTSSIAGLITGSAAPVYSMTKWAVIRVSEALLASLREEGHPIGVTVLCPGLVRTRIYESERNRPPALVPAAGKPLDEPGAADMPDRAMDPDIVANLLCEAIGANRFYLLTTDKFDSLIRDRVDAILEGRDPTFRDPTIVGR
jgi:NAD(P)-dependent dehydrogenase (short-subunit alcohol dehydrogenase family)